MPHDAGRKRRRFSHTASHGSVGGEGAFAERCESLAVEQRLEILSVELLDLLNFV